MSVLLPNMFPQSVTFRTQVAVSVFLHITDVAEVVFIQIQIHGIFKAIGGRCTNRAAMSPASVSCKSYTYTFKLNTAPIPPNHPMSHPWSLQGSCLAVVDTVCNTFWLKLLRLWHLEFHDVWTGIGKSIGCLYRIHRLQLPKQRQLCSSKYGLEGRLWHQSGGQTACWHKTSHCSSIVINTVIVTAGTFEP